MYFIYLDESGNTGKDHTSINQPIHFISGVAIKRDCMQKVENDVKRLLPNFLPHSQNYDFEFHGEEMFRGKKYFKHHELEKRLSAFNAIVDIAKNNSLIFFSQGIDKKKHNRKYINPYHPHNVAFMYLIEKIDKFLEEKNAFGVVVMDKGNNLEQEIINDFDYYKESGTAYGSFSREIKFFLDNVFYVESHNSYLLQIADVIGYIYSSKRLSDRGIGNKNSYHRKYILSLYNEMKDLIRYKAIDPSH